MQPFHAATLNLGARIGDGEQEEVVRLDQRDDRLGVPGGDSVEVSGEVTHPGAANRALNGAIDHINRSLTVDRGHTMEAERWFRLVMPRNSEPLQ